MKYLLSGKEMKKWEEQAMEEYKLPSLLLMERAGMAVTEELLSGRYNLQKVLVACGTGNNGGDGLAVARMLMNRGIRVDVCVAGSLENLSEDAKKQLEMYMALMGKFVTAPVYHAYTVIVDALFGIGCDREVTGLQAEVIGAINQSQVPVVSIDVPSGICADNGMVCAVAVKAQTTVTFYMEKIGLLLYPGREYCGTIRVADLGVPFRKQEVCQALTYTEEDLALLPKRAAYSHKGTFGKVLVMAGSPSISGAAYFTAAAAYRMGAGLVKIYTPKENQLAMQTLLPEALLEIYDRDCPRVKQLQQCLAWADAIVIGPGFGQDSMAEKILNYVLSKSTVPVIVDADGINLLARNKARMLEKHAPLILTPHVQEMAGLVGSTAQSVSKNLALLALHFIDQYPVTLVLKDAGTIVASARDLLYINTSGNSGMATGGSGDVLAGMIAALVAQGMDELGAARLGVYVHGRAGDAATKKKSAYSVMASDILDGIAEVTRV